MIWGSQRLEDSVWERVGFGYTLGCRFRRWDLQKHVHLTRIFTHTSVMLYSDSYDFEYAE